MRLTIPQKEATLKSKRVCTIHFSEHTNLFRPEGAPFRLIHFSPRKQKLYKVNPWNAEICRIHDPTFLGCSDTSRTNESAHPTHTKNNKFWYPLSVFVTRGAKEVIGGRNPICHTGTRATRNRCYLMSYLSIRYFPAMKMSLSHDFTCEKWACCPKPRIKSSTTSSH